MSPLTCPACDHELHIDPRTTRKCDTCRKPLPEEVIAEVWQQAQSDGVLSAPPSGEFWADRIKKFRDKPVERLELAKDNLPTPAAYREAAIALRALIRKADEGSDKRDALLRELYELACEHGFFYETREVAGYPAFNLTEIIPDTQFSQISRDYQQIGFRALPLLNKTDQNWFAEAWGAPANTQTAREANANLWEDWVQKFEGHLEAQERRFDERVAQLTAHPDAKQQQGCAGVVVLIIAGLFALAGL